MQDYAKMEEYNLEQQGIITNWHKPLKISENNMLLST
jgi:hypothetical protein